MLNNSVIRELKQADKNVFRALNALYGFDFEKPFTAFKFEESFTVAKINKEIDKFDLVAPRIVVILKGSAYGWRKEKLLAVEITGTGAADFDITHNKRWFEYSTRIDSYFVKGDFNEDRKRCEVAYVIAQNDDLLSGAYKTTPHDMKERYKVIKGNKAVKNWKTEREYSYINEVELIDLAHKGEKFTYKSLRYLYGQEPRELTDVFDKSGYYLMEKRTDLKSRAKSLREERAAARFKETDNRAIIDGLQEQLTTLKGLICDQLKAATTTEELKKVEKSLSWYKGLGDCFDRLERIKTGEAEKSFSSIGAFNDKVNTLKGLISEIEKGVA